MGWGAKEITKKVAIVCSKVFCKNTFKQAMPSASVVS